MAYKETSVQSWSKSISDSLKNAVLGLVLAAAGVGGLFWNEGRAVKTARALEEAQSIVHPVADNGKIDPAMEGKLVHMTGTAVTDDLVGDLPFGIFHHGIKLSRRVKYYQWEESSHTEEHTNRDGSITETTTYTYDKGWEDNPIDSRKFKQPDHDNVVCMPGIKKEVWQAENVAFGAFKLNKGQIARVDNETTYSLAEYKAPENLADNSAIVGNELYVSWPTDRQASRKVPLQPVGYDRQAGKVIYGHDQQTGKPIYGYDPQTDEPILDPQAVPPARPAQPSTADPDNPDVGDMRVTWTTVSPKEDVSLVAVQTKGTFAPYVSESSGYEVDLFSCGTKTSDEMFRDAFLANAMMTWLIRLGGWLAMFIGFRMFLKPTSVVLGVVPFLGTLARVGMSLVAIFLSTVIALVVVAVAWLFYRPVLGIIVLAIVAGLIVWDIKRKKAKTPQIQA